MPTEMVVTVDQFSLRQLEYFVVAASHGSMGAAARQLGLSQSAVSTAISELESALACDVFVRHARGLTLTGPGRRLLPQVKEILQSTDTLRATASGEVSELRGELVIGCYSTLSANLLPRVIDPFLTEHPLVDVTVLQGTYESLLQKLITGECEVVILYNYGIARIPTPAGLVTYPVAQAKPHVLLPDHHPLADETGIRLEMLRDEPLVLYDHYPSADYFMYVLEQHQHTPQIRLRTSGFELARAMVARGFGYTLMTEWSFSPYSEEGLPLVSLPLLEVTAELAVIVARLEAIPTTARAKEFIRHILQLRAN